MPPGFDFLQWASPENDTAIKFYNVLLRSNSDAPFRPQFVHLVLILNWEDT